VSTSAFNSSTTSISATLAGTTAGSIILACAYYRNRSVTAITCSDTTNGAYTALSALVNDGNQGIGCAFYFQNNAGGTLVVSAPETGATASIGNIQVLEVLGGVTSGGLAQIATGIFNGSSGSAAASSVTTSGTPQASAMIVSMTLGTCNVGSAVTDNASGASPSSGWTIASNTATTSAGGSGTGCMSSYLASSVGTYNDAYAASGTNFWFGITATVAIVPAFSGAYTVSPSAISYASALQQTNFVYYPNLSPAPISYSYAPGAVTFSGGGGGGGGGFPLVMLINALTYNYSLAPASSDTSINPNPLVYSYSPQGAQFGLTVTLVPSVLGLTSAAASLALVAAGFVVSIGATVYSAQYPIGTVALQSIPGGSSAIPGATVVIQFSLGPPPPGVLTIAQAIQAIIQAGLVPVVLYTPSSTVPAGMIIPGSQSPPAGTMVLPGSQQALVSFVVSAGPPTTIGNVAMPNCIGLFIQNAYQALQAVNLSVDRLTWAVSNAPDATVTAQSIPAGTQVESGTIVKLTASLGPTAASKAVATPDVS
jgi:beta-lactam-binding protein with PASTA domain